jgi:16S rRNA (cytosine1402-N4)-methyltransferase
MSHKTVLVKETLECMDIKPNDVVFEGTGGEGGLSHEIVSRLGPSGTLVITELDRHLSSRLRKLLSQAVCTVYVEQDNFRNIAAIIRAKGIKALDAIILDLGLASYHYEESGRGFSFLRDEPLLMTLDDSPRAGITARDAVNTWKEETLKDIFAALGGERAAAKIAKTIVFARREKSIENTGELVKIIEEAVGIKRGVLHPATRVFQALRIAVNDEGGALAQALRDGWDSLREGGRFVVISFHEGEDRKVKEWSRSLVTAGEGVLLNKKAIAPSRAELKANPRSRSAKLRAVRKVTKTHK